MSMSPPYYVMLILSISSRSSSLKVYQKIWFFFHASVNKSIFIQVVHQTKLNYTKPNSSILNQTQPHQTKLIHTKPNSTKPNQTRPHQTKLYQSKQYPVFAYYLLVVVLFTLVISQNCDRLTFVSPGISERGSAIQKPIQLILSSPHNTRVRNELVKEEHFVDIVVEASYLELTNLPKS